MQSTFVCTNFGVYFVTLGLHQLDFNYYQRTISFYHISSFDVYNFINFKITVFEYILLYMYRHYMCIQNVEISF